jgi:S-DNA-T family DNA segregation ATPase FtsK/SpoIIIE
MPRDWNDGRSATATGIRARRPTLQLDVTVRGFGDSADLAFAVGTDTRLRDVLLAARERLHGQDSADRQLAATCERLGTWLDLDRPIGDAGLAQGDTLVIGSFEDLQPIVESRSAPPPGGVELVFHGGPRAGRRVPLAPGEHVLGRDPRLADIAVPEDPSLSARHAAINVIGDGVTVTDLGSTNGSFLDGVALRSQASVAVPPGSLLEAGRTALSWRLPAPEAASRAPDREGRLHVNRPPRIRQPWVPSTIVVPTPPDDPRRMRIPILASLVPIALGIVLWWQTETPAMLLLSLLGPVVAIVSRAEEAMSGSRELGRQAAAFRAELQVAAGSLRDARLAEATGRRTEAPDAATLLDRVRQLSADLWARRPSDPDFLHLRVGSADQPRQTVVEMPTTGSPTLRSEAKALVEPLDNVPSVPVLVLLDRWRSVALVGTGDRVDGLGRWLVLQAAILHSPAELRIMAAIGPARLGAWDWLKWLPHVRSPVAANGLEALNIGLGEVAAERVLDAVDSPDSLGSRARPWTLLVIDGALRLDPARVARLLEADAGDNTAVIWLAGESETVPNGVASLVRLDDARARLELVEVASGRVISGATTDGLSAVLAEETARRLAPLRDAAASIGADQIPSQVTLLEALGEATRPGAIEASWQRSVPVACVGMSAAGRFEIDLLRDGPHVLVGGTTGSGKSELLQTLVAALALSCAPSRVSFLLVDYKGGAAFRECVSLPHVVGFITDLDDHLARRALVSLEAEIRRREAVLASLGSKDILAAIARDPLAAPAFLVIVIDEFAVLAQEIPDFITGIVDIARRGRTLGVHLVLATQRPAGAVTREIWANTNLRVALRVTDAADSTDVIGVPDAAMIPRDRPGRAIARIGQSAPIEFQAAFVGSPVDVQPRPSVIVRPFAWPRAERAALKAHLAASPAPKPPEGQVTELRAIVELVSESADRLGIGHPPPPWLPPLPAVLPAGQVGAEARAGVAVIGLLDDPARQLQEPFALDLARDGSLLVFGGAGSGKSTVLRTLAASLAEQSSPADLHLYGLDFGAGGIRSVEVLPHCGGIIAGADEERTARLLGMLQSELVRRQQLLAERRVHDLAEYRAAVGPGLPRIVLLLDGYGAFATSYERVQLGTLVDLVPRLAADGRAVGIHVAITADRRASVPGRLAGVVQRRLVLRLSDESEYAQHSIERRAYSGLRFRPGRGLSEAGHEVQVVLPGDDPSPVAQAAAIAHVAERARAEHPGVSAPRVAILPTQLRASTLPGPTGTHCAVLGLRDRDLAPAEVSLVEAGLLVAGPLHCGRSTALATVVRSLQVGSDGARFHLLAPRRTPLTSLTGWSSVHQGVEACDAAIDRLAAEAVQGWDAVRFLIIDDGEELFESRSAGSLATVVRRGRDVGLRVVAAVELRSALRAYGGWLGELRKERQGLLLQPGQEMAGELLGTTLPRQAGSRPMPLGRGYLVIAGDPELVQVAEPDWGAGR